MSTPTKPTRPRQTRPPKRASRAKQASPGKSHAELTNQLRELRLPMFREHFEPLAERAIAEPLSPTEYLAELTELECQGPAARAGSRV